MKNIDNPIEIPFDFTTSEPHDDYASGMVTKPAKINCFRPYFTISLFYN